MIDQQVLSQYNNTYDGIIQERFDNLNTFIRLEIEEQYINLNNLGIDFIKDSVINDDIYIDFINYIDDSYISIVNIQNIFDNPIQLQIIGKQIYQIFCVDIINEIIPRLLKYLEIKDSLELELVSESLIKDGLFNISQKKLELLKKLHDVNLSSLIRYEIIKTTLFIDIIDNDIESLLENFIFPICEKYASVFYSKTP